MNMYETLYCSNCGAPTTHSITANIHTEITTEFPSTKYRIKRCTRCDEQSREEV